MEKLIYYPNFEPPENAWLKFALLYFDQFKSIVPNNRLHLLSDNYRRIHNETDLVELYSPGYEVSNIATSNAIEEANKIIHNAHERSYLFRSVNVLNNWRNPDNWNYEICGEKFAYEWIQFCESNSVGRKTEDGVLVSEELGFLFMSYLAKEISYAEDATIITDNNKFDTFSNYSRTTTPSTYKRNKLAKEIINVVVPGNVADIPFERLIEFRNSNRALITSFNIELKNVQSEISYGNSAMNFIDRYNNIKNELFNAIMSQGTGLLVIPISAYILLNTHTSTSSEYVKEIIGGLGMTYAGLYSINKSLDDIRNKRLCKKYLTNLQQLR